jgi:hypothetical protein
MADNCQRRSKSTVIMICVKMYIIIIFVLIFICLCSGKGRVKLIGVEAENGHFEFVKQHLSDNGIDWRQHRLEHKALFHSSYDNVLSLLNARKYVQRKKFIFFDNFEI